MIAVEFAASSGLVGNVVVVVGNVSTIPSNHWERIGRIAPHVPNI